MTKTWFITGANAGFGRILAEKLLARGDRVAGTFRRDGALADPQDTYGGRLWTAKLDLTDLAAIRATVDRAFADLSRIDVVVSNAAYGLFGAAEEATDEQIRHQLDTNLLGSIALIRAALPHLREQGGGKILQVSSEGGQRTYPSFSLYHATKWGIEGFVEAVAQEVAPFGISMSLIEPGPAGTNFGASLVRTTPLDIYEDTPAGMVRRAIGDGSFKLTGDPVKMVDAMIACGDSPTPPLRLALGSIAYESIHTALTERLKSLEAQKDIAYSADLD
jgi:NAD(P)-dependent dehydrogenase (short-subunit alcohol dehydrogenase family)